MAGFFGPDHVCGLPEIVVSFGLHLLNQELGASVGCRERGLGLLTQPTKP